MWSPASAGSFGSRIYIKTPGNPSRVYDLQPQSPGSSVLNAGEDLPLSIRCESFRKGSETKIILTITAAERVYYHLEHIYRTEFAHDDCQFYMPGFWYHRNLRSPKEAPSFHTGDSWQVREDRLSAPLTGIYDEPSGRYCAVLRTDSLPQDALACHNSGEVILSGYTSLGFTGFRNVDSRAALVFGYPWSEAPYSYIRKLTLAPEVRTFDKLEKGEMRRLSWSVFEGGSDSYSAMVSSLWSLSFDRLDPQPLAVRYTPAAAKSLLSQYFARSYVDDYPLKFYSGVELRTDDPRSNGIAEVGFIGRVLLNAFNAWEYGSQTEQAELARNARSVFDSYLQYGFTPGGLLREVVDFRQQREPDVYSIRRQSEGVYALLTYLAYEKSYGRTHRAWESRIKTLLDRFLQLQQADGSFPRKFRDDLSIVDSTGGSTPSATLPLAMAYAYFQDESYLEAARRTAIYLEHAIISAADYFSSTLDANCEDKEASLYAATAMYYMARITKGAERRHYTDLCRQAASFALSWYYLWDVPFAPGQMLGDLGFHTRGWGNVSVENNHVDVFVFEFASVLDWLSKTCGEPRFSLMSAVIRSSMLQLIPSEEMMFGIGRVGYCPEVVQHTTWDYGKNGKGFYNDIFAPGWTVASLWQLLSPNRVEEFFSSCRTECPCGRSGGKRSQQPLKQPNQ